MERRDMKKSQPQSMAKGSIHLLHRDNADVTFDFGLGNGSEVVGMTTESVSKPEFFPAGSERRTVTRLA